MFQVQTIWSFAKDCFEKDTFAGKVQHTEERISEHKECSHLYEGDPEEENVMVSKCHSSENCISIQPNREVDQYYKQLNQVKGGTDAKSFHLDCKSHHLKYIL